MNLKGRLPLTEEEDKLLDDTKMELEDKLLDRVKGIMFRCKAKWYEEGEEKHKVFLFFGKN